ncbi:MAG: putative Fe-S center protein [Holophagaceae bacterium]|nr:putative Fe-S center protein [Holophagaceae bacterium]
MSKPFSRRTFLKAGAATVGAVAAARLAGAAPVEAPTSTVYFTEDISSAGLLKVFAQIRGSVSGKVAIKIHTGEPHGPNILPRDMVKALQQSIPNSALVETNTLYKGGRFTTEEHRKTIQTNGWDFCPVDIMDEDGAVMIPVKGGKHFKEMSVGRHMLNYDAMVVLTHFKGHAMGGFGGSMKNIAIGCADGPIGKKMVHAAPDNEDYSKWLAGAPFMENMVESAKATVDHFGRRIVFINVLRNMSVDCDCAGVRAAPPKARNLGILASTDLLAVDKASIDMVYKLPEAELHDLRERIESRSGLRQISYMKELKMGNDSYKLVRL